MNAMNTNDVGNPPAPPGPDTGHTAAHEICGRHGGGDGSEPRGGVERKRGH
ncbi:hypothetical protein J2W56_000586 [Nocardia kruczakiae]|uniref:Uncharacterized protein n=1 Tax=Nocardia kruczakiae TaxID=261477 RepID=A0ABU1X8J8_9NOCA|nr:hypothetical protein [Nocardia kruczakiae]MDR7166868.1 hypothetical protein [Nocardia kruczakiae]